MKFARKAKSQDSHSSKFWILETLQEKFGENESLWKMPISTNQKPRKLHRHTTRWPLLKSLWNFPLSWLGGSWMPRFSIKKKQTNMVLQKNLKKKDTF